MTGSVDLTSPVAVVAAEIGDFLTREHWQGWTVTEDPAGFTVTVHPAAGLATCTRDDAERLLRYVNCTDPHLGRRRAEGLTNRAGHTLRWHRWVTVTVTGVTDE